MGHVARGLVDRGVGDGRLEPEGDERIAGLGADIGVARICHRERVLLAALGDHLIGRGTADRQPTLVMSLVAREASKGKVARLVRATFAAVDDVMELEGARRSAAGCLAAAPIAEAHEPIDRGRDGLGRTSRPVSLQRSDMLRIAARAIYGGRVDGDADARTLDPALIAALADDRRDLERRAAAALDRDARGRSARRGLRFRGLQHRARQRGDQLVVVEVATVLLVELEPSLRSRA